MSDLDSDYHVEAEFTRRCYCGREWVCEFWGERIGEESAVTAETRAVRRWGSDA
jgi:hypothetical protein